MFADVMIVSDIAVKFSHKNADFIWMVGF